MGWYQVTKEYRRSLSPEGCSNWGLHAFPGQLASTMDPVPGFTGLITLDIDWDRAVHLLNLLFSILVGVYSTTSRPFACLGEILEVAPPPRVISLTYNCT